MTQIRQYKDTDLRDIQLVQEMLKAARILCKKVGAKQTLRKIRSALKSAEGAERHVWHTRNRAAYGGPPPHDAATATGMYDHD